MRQRSSSKRSRHHLKHLVEEIVSTECRLAERGLAFMINELEVVGVPPQQLKLRATLHFLPLGSSFCCGEPGCASINFAIAGKTPPAGMPLQILSDYEWDIEAGAKFGVFVFAKADLLAGLEVYSIDGLAAADRLPKIGELKPIEWTKK